jgi:hypothetical protein
MLRVSGSKGTLFLGTETNHHRPTPVHLPACGLARYQKPRQPVATSPSHSRAAVSFRGPGDDSLEKSPPEDFHSRSRMPDKTPPVSRCCFLASLRTTNASKQYEPRVLLSKLPQLHESPQPPGSRRGRGAAGRRVPSAQCPVPSAHLGGAQNRCIT